MKRVAGVARIIVVGADHSNVTTRTHARPSSDRQDLWSRLFASPQVFVQIGASFLACLVAGDDRALAAVEQRSRLDHRNLFGAYMVSVPVLVTLTDHFDAPANRLLVGVALTATGHSLQHLRGWFWSAFSRGRLRASAGPAPT
jgi:hypothetical protein